MLLSLDLENFKRHERLSVNFTAGLNVIMGPNYRGKSSILHGVLYAFFGASAVPCKAEKIPRSGSTTFRVMLRFTLAGSDDVWRIVRTKTKDEIWKGDELIANGKTMVAAKIESLIGMSQSQFLRLMYAEQKKAEVLMTLGSTELNKTIEEVAGTSLVKDVITKLTATMKTANDSADAIRSVMGEAPDLTAQEHLENAVLEARHAVAAHTGARDTAVKRLQKAEGEVRRLELEERTHAELQAAATRAHQRLEQTAEALRGLTVSDIPTATAELEATAAELATAGQKLTVLGQEFKTMQAARTAYTMHQHALQAARDGVAAWQEPPAAPCEPVTPEQALKAADDNAAAQGAASAAAQKVRDLLAAQAGGVCSACKRPFDDHDPAQMEAELDAAKAASQEAIAEANRHKEVVRGLAQRQQQYLDWEKSRDRALAEKQRLDAHLATLDGQVVPEATTEALAALREQGDALAAKVSTLKATKASQEEALRKATDAHSAFNAAKLAHSEAVTRANGSAFAPADLDAAKTEKDAAYVESSRAGTELQGAEQAFALADRELSAWLAATNRYEEMHNKLLTHEQRHGQAKKLRAFLQDNFDAFMSETWEGLLAMASHFTRQGTEGFISQLLRSDDGKFEYIEEGEQYSVMGSASGAQRSLMGLSTQIALSEMLPCPLPLLLLDEASADMDPDVSAALVTVLRNLGKQVVVVSHREMDAAVADNVIALE